MKSRLTSLVLMVTTMLSSVAFADFEVSFKRSQAIWDQLKSSANLDYSYVTEYQSWIGLGQTTRIRVQGDTVKQRSFERWRWYYDYNDQNTYKRETLETWVENGQEVGTHDEGERPKNLDQIYSQCLSEVLSLDPDLNTVEFNVDEKGLIKTCRARNIYCADDCWEGIDIVSLQFRTAGQAVEGCQQKGEEILCSFAAGTCTYVPSVAVMFIDHCGYRNEKIILRETQQQSFCPVLYQYSNGLFLNHEDWIQNTPCSLQ